MQSIQQIGGSLVAVWATMPIVVIIIAMFLLVIMIGLIANTNAIDKKLEKILEMMQDKNQGSKL